MVLTRPMPQRLAQLPSSHQLQHLRCTPRPLITLFGGIALATLLEGVARLITIPPGASADPTPALNRLLVSLNELKATLPALIAQAAPPSPPEMVSGQMESPDYSLAANANIELHLAHMVKLLEEMKEVSMLDETQRQNRRKQSLARRKNSRLEEAARFINSQDWQQAMRCCTCWNRFTPMMKKCWHVGSSWTTRRIVSQADGWDHLNHRVNDLLALSNYPGAIDACMQFLEQFPAHTDCQQLAVRIRQEQANYHEATSNRLYDEIKSAVENRKWRTATGRHSKIS